MKKRRLSQVTILLLLSLVFSMAFQGLAEPVFALYGPERANVDLFIHGEKSNGGPILNTSGELGSGLWAPGVSSTGTIRIYNNYSNRVSIHNLGIRMKLYNTLSDQIVTDPELVKEFSEAMKLTIKKGRGLIFQNTIYDKSFKEMLFSKDNSNQRGYELGILDRVSIGKDESVDLQYTVHMSENAGDNLQGLKAMVDFIVNSAENPYTGPPDVDGDDDKEKGKKDIPDRLVEEPLEVIPDIGGHWAHDCIVALIKHDVLDPDENSSIRPEDYITRAEAAMLIGRALKLKPSTASSSGYLDAVPTWAKGYIIATTEAKVFKGYPGKVFKPFMSISREEMTAVLIRAFKEDADGGREIEFKDKHKIAKWARGNVAASVEDGIVTGYSDNTFRPKAYMTRAEAFTIVCKLLGYHEEHNKNR